MAIFKKKTPTPPKKKLEKGLLSSFSSDLGNGFLVLASIFALTFAIAAVVAVTGGAALPATAGTIGIFGLTTGSLGALFKGTSLRMDKEAYKAYEAKIKALTDKEVEHIHRDYVKQGIVDKPEEKETYLDAQRKIIEQDEIAKKAKEKNKAKKQQEKKEKRDFRELARKKSEEIDKDAMLEDPDYEQPVVSL